mmetsp:Transcript_11198/g.34557  ORF Transcript_11198/g.34557 Transcript_11198/m.34557 type:complete len:276 (+) Transcript_11198:723-1550(+)
MRFRRRHCASSTPLSSDTTPTPATAPSWRRTATRARSRSTCCSRTGRISTAARRRSWTPISTASTRMRATPCCIPARRATAAAGRRGARALLPWDSWKSTALKLTWTGTTAPRRSATSATSGARRTSEGCSLGRCVLRSPGCAPRARSCGGNVRRTPRSRARCSRPLRRRASPSRYRRRRRTAKQMKHLQLYVNMASWCSGRSTGCLLVFKRAMPWPPSRRSTIDSPAVDRMPPLTSRRLLDGRSSATTCDWTTVRRIRAGLSSLTASLGLLGVS